MITEVSARGFSFTIAKSGSTTHDWADVFNHIRHTTVLELTKWMKADHKSNVSRNPYAADSMSVCSSLHQSVRSALIANTAKRISSAVLSACACRCMRSASGGSETVDRAASESDGSRISVFLNLYHLGSADRSTEQSSCLRGLSRCFHCTNRALGANMGGLGFYLGGFYHSAVQFYDDGPNNREWFYSPAGVHVGKPRGDPLHTFLAQIPLGKTKKSKEEIGRILLEFAIAPADYHVIENNCNHFVENVCKRLGDLDPVPRGINRFARGAVQAGRGCRPSALLSRFTA